jgi:hypothetical protein
MVRRVAILGAVVAAMMPAVAVAAPPTDTQKTQFMQECMRNSGGNSTLCSCKTEQAEKLIDADFMAIVLKTMNGATLPVDQSKNYAIYISRSNAVCAPGM